MKLLQKVRPKKNKPEPNPLDLFEIVADTCLYCQHGPLIKFEPAQFKYQCWTCYRIVDKADVMVGPSVRFRAPESRWIEDRIHGRKLPPMTDELYAAGRDKEEIRVLA